MPTASAMAALSCGSTLKDSEMHDWATSMDSVSSVERVPSLRELERKSMMARASRFLDSVAFDGGCQFWRMHEVSCLP